VNAANHENIFMKASVALPNGLALRAVTCTEQQRAAGQDDLADIRHDRGDAVLEAALASQGENARGCLDCGVKLGKIFEHQR
jgi:hypothetical protein